MNTNIEIPNNPDQTNAANPEQARREQEIREKLANKGNAKTKAREQIKDYFADKANTLNDKVIDELRGFENETSVA